MNFERTNTLSGMPPVRVPETEQPNKRMYKDTGVTKRDGTIEPLNVARWHDALVWASAGKEHAVSIPDLIEEACRNVFNGISSQEVEDALILAAVAFIEKDPAYGYISARLLIKKLFKDVAKQSIMGHDTQATYRQIFIKSIKQGVEFKLLAPEMLSFDLEQLAAAFDLERDSLIDYMGVKTLNERYFTKYNDVRLELPQAFWMRVAMGLALNEADKNERSN